jgi:hypothetical protein
MSFWPSWKYQMDGMKWPLIVFYGVIVALLVLMGVSMTIVAREHNQFSVGGLEMASMIFLFIAGLNSFKATFHMLSANSVSRKTMFVSFLAVIGIVAAGMAVIDSVYGLIMRALGDYNPMFIQLYGGQQAALGVMAGKGFLWMFCSYLAAGMTGYFITTLYYRMNKPVKLLVSIGIPVLLFIVGPALDVTLFNSAVSNAFAWFFAWSSGLASGNPFMGMISDIVLVAALGGLSFIALRRTPVKTKTS